MGIKREFKKLLNEKQKQLRFTIMDQRFYNEIHAKLLSLNVEELKDGITKIEVEMKQMENYRGKDSIEKKVGLKRAYEQAQEVYQRVMEIRKTLTDLAGMEKDYREYILYMEAYISLKRWKQ